MSTRPMPHLLTLPRTTLALVALAALAGGCSGSVDEANLMLNVAAVAGILAVLGIAVFAVSRQRTRTDDVQSDRIAEEATVRAESAEDELESVWTLGLPLVRVDNRPPLREAHYLRASEAFCRLLGYSCRDILAVPYMTLVSAHCREATIEMADRIDALGSAVVADFVNAYTAGSLHRRPGSDVWLQWMAAGVAADTTMYHVTDVTVAVERAAAVRAERDEAVSDLEAMRPAVNAILRQPVSPAVLPPDALLALVHASQGTPAEPGPVTSVSKTTTTTYPNGSTPPAPTDDAP